MAKRVLTGACAAAISLACAAAFAHHSMAMFDNQQTITIEGTVKEFQWTNPHVWIQLMVKDPATHQEVEWSVEADSPNVLTRRGWTRKSIKPGDKAVIALHPLKSVDAKGGGLVSVAVNGERIGTPGFQPGL